MPGSQDVGICDPLEVFCLYGPKRIQGFSKGQYFSATPRSQGFTADEGTDACVTVTKMAGKLWDASITLSQSSSSNDILDDFFQAALSTPGGIFHPFSFTHGGTKMVAAVAVIASRPTIGRSDGTGDTYVWPFILTQFDGKIRALRSALPAEA
jgi:hypothetical protein